MVTTALTLLLVGSIATIHPQPTELAPLAAGVGRVGVQLQWGTAPLQPGLIANLSRAFDAARIDFLWTMVEKTRGQYEFSEYDELAAQLRRHNVTAAWNLDYGNPLWQNRTGPPQSVAVTSPQAVAAFARFAVASVRHFRGQGIVWGIYNEPNGHGFGTDPAAYVRLASAVGTALSAAGLGDEKVTGPHVDGGFPILMGPGGWLNTVLSGGLLETVDAVAVHPYRGDGCDTALPPVFCAPCDSHPGGCGPETVLADYARLRALIAKNLPAGKATPPLIASEVGCSTCAPHTSAMCCQQGHAADPCGKVRCLGAWFSAGHRDEQGQAQMVARQILVDAFAGVAMTFIYDYKDDGANLAASEQNFGVTRSDNSPKPAFAAAATARKVLSGSSTVERLVPASGGIFALQFADRARATTAVAVWNATGDCGVQNGSFPLQISSPARCFSVTTLVGADAGTVCRVRAGGELVLTGVSEAVLYLRPAPSTVDTLKTDDHVTPAAASVPLVSPDYVGVGPDVSFADALAILALAGLANRDAPTLWLNTSATPLFPSGPRPPHYPHGVAVDVWYPGADAVWREYLGKVKGLGEFDVAKDSRLCTLLGDARLQTVPKGLVLYEASAELDGLQWAALTAAGLYDGLPVTSAMIARHSCLQTLPTVFALPGASSFQVDLDVYRWAVEALLPRTNKRIVVSACKSWKNYSCGWTLAPGVVSLDYAVSARAFVLNLSPDEAKHPEQGRLWVDGGDRADEQQRQRRCHHPPLGPGRRPELAGRTCAEAGEIQP